MKRAVKYHSEDKDKAGDLICLFEGCRKAFQRKSKYQDHITHHTKQCLVCQQHFFPGIPETCIRRFALEQYAYNAILSGIFFSIKLVYVTTNLQCIVRQRSDVVVELYINILMVSLPRS